MPITVISHDHEGFLLCRGLYRLTGYSISWKSEYRPLNLYLNGYRSVTFFATTIDTAYNNRIRTIITIVATI